MLRIDGEMGVGAVKASAQVKRRQKLQKAAGSIVDRATHSQAAPAAPSKFEGHKGTVHEEVAALAAANPAAAAIYGEPAEHQKPFDATGLGLSATAHDQIKKQVNDSRESQLTPDAAHDIPDITDMRWQNRRTPEGRPDVQPYQTEALKAKAVADQKLGKQEYETSRADALGMAAGALSSADLQEMTTEKYNALTPEQRAAVDFNTMLATAVHKDKHRQDLYAKTSTPLEHATYDKAVDRMFGPDHGSDLYAPETVAVLRQLKIEDKSADLDQFLGLNVAITQKDLKHVASAEPIDVHVPDQQDFRHQLQIDLVDKTQEMKQELSKSTKLLQNFQSTAKGERLEDVGFLGGESKTPKPALGFGTTDADKYLQRAFDAYGDISNRGQRDSVLSVIKQDLAANGLPLEAFTSYADARTHNSEWYDVALGDTPKVRYPSAERYRTLLGLNGE